MSRKQSLAVVLICAALTMVVIMAAGCAPAIVRARQAVGAAATLGTTAGELFAAVDASEQQAIAAAVVKDRDVAKAERARDEWRAKQLSAVRALKTYNATVSALGAAAEISQAEGKFQIGQLLGGLARAFAQLKDALSAYGVALPAFGGL